MKFRTNQIIDGFIVGKIYSTNIQHLGIDTVKFLGYKNYTEPDDVGQRLLGDKSCIYCKVITNSRSENLRNLRYPAGIKIWISKSSIIK